VWHDLFVVAKWRVHVSDVTHSRVCPASKESGCWLGARARERRRDYSLSRFAVAVRCSVLRCVAVYYSVLQNNASFSLQIGEIIHIRDLQREALRTELQTRSQRKDRMETRGVADTAGNCWKKESTVFFLFLLIAAFYSNCHKFGAGHTATVIATVVSGNTCFTYEFRTICQLRQDWFERKCNLSRTSESSLQSVSYTQFLLQRTKCWALIQTLSWRSQTCKPAASAQAWLREANAERWYSIFLACRFAIWSEYQDLEESQI